MVNSYDTQAQLLKQLLNTLLTHLDSMKYICDNIRAIVESPAITFNCVELKSAPSITAEELKECIKKMKSIPTLMDIIEKRGE